MPPREKHNNKSASQSFEVFRGFLPAEEVSKYVSGSSFSSSKGANAYLLTYCVGGKPQIFETSKPTVKEKHVASPCRRESVSQSFEVFRAFLLTEEVREVSK